MPAQVAFAADACANCVCATGAAQGALADQAACTALCVKNGTTFKSCATADATPAPATNVPAPKLCHCWCTSAGGAKEQSSVVAPDACPTICKKSGERMAACAFKLDQTPTGIPFCFTQKLCEKQNGKLDDKQAPECIPGQKYCYPDPAKAAKTTLNVAIGGYTVSGNVGEYINTVITWLLNAGIIIVIVMVMIGGLEYTLGAAQEEMVGKGKKRIKDAITGLVLLMCSYVILFTVNPYLIRMQLPQYPMVKRVDLIDNAACETLQDEYTLKTIDGKDIADADKKCGTSASIVSKKDGGSVTGATTCDYQKCDEPSKKCVGSGKDAKCLKCSEIVGGLPGIVPSSAVCNKLKLDDVVTKTGDTTKVITANYCFFTHDPTVIASAAEEAKILAALAVGTLASGGNPIVALSAGGYVGADTAKKLIAGVCAESNINCNAIAKCSDYDTEAKAYSAATNNDPSSMENFFLNSLVGDFNLKKLCEANPCNIKPISDDGKGFVEGVAQTSVCKYDDLQTVKTDCIQRVTGQVMAAEQPTKIGSCDEKECVKSGGQCVEDSNGNKACATCEKVINGNTLGGGGILPTDVMCQNLDAGFVGTPGTSSYKAQRCLSTTDSNMLANFGKGNKTCAKFLIDCTNQNITKCSDYDNQVTVSNDKNSGVSLDDVSDRFFGICPENPCGVNGSNGCKIGITGNDCVDK